MAIRADCGWPPSTWASATLSWLAAHGRPIRYGYVERPWPIEMYQNVYATVPGSAEMPSAGPAVHPRRSSPGLVAKGVGVAPVVLHTGVASLEADELPYPERMTRPGADGRAGEPGPCQRPRVIAVGTTVVRALETAAGADGSVSAYDGWTDLVISPDRGVRVVDGMITGWHEPASSHLMMLEAIAGRELLATPTRRRWPRASGGTSSGIPISSCPDTSSCPRLGRCRSSRLRPLRSIHRRTDRLQRVRVAPGRRDLRAVPSVLRAAAPGRRRRQEIGAARGVVLVRLGMLAEGATHSAWPPTTSSSRSATTCGPATRPGKGSTPSCGPSSSSSRRRSRRSGVVVWPMVELEADDALASAASVAAEDPAVDQVVICTPDKDLAQCVVGERVVQLDRRKGVVTDEDGVWAKFGVAPRSIPDWLALVGDSADGFPGSGRVGQAVGLGGAGPLRDARRRSPTTWPTGTRRAPGVRGAARLAARLADEREQAELFRTARHPPARTRTARRGGRPGMARADRRSSRQICRHFRDPALAERAAALATG